MIGENPDNYRGISLLSVISKCYTWRVEYANERMDGRKRKKSLNHRLALGIGIAPLTTFSLSLLLLKNVLVRREVSCMLRL